MLNGSPSTRVLATVTTCALLATLGGCTPPSATQLLLTLSGDLDDPGADGSPAIDGVRVRVLQVLPPSSADRGEPACDVDGETVSRNGHWYVQRLCRDFSLGPGGDVQRLEDLRLGVLPFPAGTMPDAGGVITVGLEVIGLVGEEERIRLAAHAQFRPNQLIRVSLTLSEYCARAPCVLGEPCTACVTVDPS